MDLLVHKYGGTSLGSIERIDLLAQKIAAEKSKNYRIAVVVSAMGHETDRLEKLALQVDASCSGREFDAVLATGEQLSAALLAIALKKHQIEAISMTGTQAGIHTDSKFNKARITDIDTKAMKKHLADGKVIIVAGFQGCDPDGNITTLGRGGSDTTAVALAASLKAKECRIYTDVDGVYTTDPRIEPNARHLTSITFEEMLEMASLGSKVLQIRAVEFAGKYNVPLRVLSTFKEGEGTLITYTDTEKTVEQAKIAGVAFNRDEAQLTITGIADKPGVAALILGKIAEQNIEVDMIVQNIGVHNNTTDFTFTVHRRDYKLALKTLKTLKETATELNAKEVVGNDKIVKVSLVGVGMRSHAGIAAKMFSSLAEKHINIHTISTSEIKVSVAIDEENLETAVRCLHEAFDLSAEETT